VFVLEGGLQVWYWDAVLFLRRAVIEGVAAAFQPGLDVAVSFLACNLLFLFSHLRVWPYRSLSANVVEGVSLFSLTLLSGAELALAFLHSISTTSPQAYVLVGGGGDSGKGGESGDNGGGASVYGAYVSSVETSSSWIGFFGLTVVTLAAALHYLMLGVRWVRERRRVRRRGGKDRANSGWSSSMFDLVEYGEGKREGKRRGEEGEHGERGKRGGGGEGNVSELKGTPTCSRNASGRSTGRSKWKRQFSRPLLFADDTDV